MPEFRRAGPGGQPAPIPTLQPPHGCRRAEMRTRGAGDSLHNVASARLTPDTLGAVGPGLILPTLPLSFPDSVTALGLGSLGLLAGPGPAFHLLHAVRYVPLVLLHFLNPACTSGCPRIMHC